MAQPRATIGCVKNLFVRQLHFGVAGDAEKGPAHLTDQLALLAKGRLSVSVDGNVTEFTAPHMIYIKAGVSHELTAITDNSVVYFVYALRNPSGDIIEPNMVPKSRELYELVQGLVLKQ
jgi:hypothetical protein